MTDIVERLRNAVGGPVYDELREASDEIERLQGELHSAHAHMNHLRRVTARLRSIADVAKDLVEECRGDLPPSLGVLARLESALHIEWQESNPQ